MLLPMWMALSRLELRNSDLRGIVGGLVFEEDGEILRSGELDTIPEAPRREDRLSSSKGSLGVPGSSSVPRLLIVSIDPLRSFSRFISLIGVVARELLMRPIFVVSILTNAGISRRILGII